MIKMMKPQPESLVTDLLGAGVSVSLSTALKGRRLLCWTRRGTAYCQLIRTEKVHWKQLNTIGLPSYGSSKILHLLPSF